MAFKEFVLSAKSNDNGESAAKKFSGKSLTEITADFLGPVIIINKSKASKVLKIGSQEKSYEY